jgi:hypothetical protein
MRALISTSSVSAGVPEPAVWVMVLLGVSMIGGVCF